MSEEILKNKLQWKPAEESNAMGLLRRLAFVVMSNYILSGHMQNAKWPSTKGETSLDPVLCLTHRKELGSFKAN